MNIVGMRSRAAAWMLAAGCLAATGAVAGPVSNGRPDSNGPPSSNGSTPLGLCSPIVDVDGDALDCSGYIAGNDSVSAIEAIIAAEGWSALAGVTLTQFKDNAVAAGAGSDTTLFDVERDQQDQSAGHLTLLDGLTGPFVLMLKGGNEWAAYYYANGAAAGTAIDFDIPGLQGAGLSHVSIYASADSVEQGSPTAGGRVPEPSSLAGALAGLGAMMWALRRRRRSG